MVWRMWACTWWPTRPPRQNATVMNRSWAERVQRAVTRIRERLEHRWAARRMNAYVDGDLDARERRRLERHADVCPECGPMRRTLVRLTRELRQLGRPPERSVAPGVIARWIEDDREYASSDGGEADIR